MWCCVTTGSGKLWRYHKTLKYWETVKADRTHVTCWWITRYKSLMKSVQGDRILCLNNSKYSLASNYFKSCQNINNIILDIILLFILNKEKKLLNFKNKYINTFQKTPFGKYTGITISIYWPLAWLGRVFAFLTMRQHHLADTIHEISIPSPISQSIPKPVTKHVGCGRICNSCISIYNKIPPKLHHL